MLLALPVEVVVLQLVTVLTAGVLQTTVDLPVGVVLTPEVVVDLGVPVVMVEVITEVVVIVLQTGDGVGKAVAQDVLIA